MSTSPSRHYAIKRSPHHEPEGRRAVLSPPGMAQNRRPSCGAVRTPRPTFAEGFRGSKRELVGGILTPALSPSDAEREESWHHRQRSLNDKCSPNTTNGFPL